MNLKDKIAGIIEDNHVGELNRERVDLDAAADAIIAALPDMIPDLVWTQRQVMGCDGLVSGDYSVHLGLWRYKDTPMSKGYGGLKEDAIAAANTHHRDAIIAEFNGETT
jgi:hypothetical protein